MSDTCSKSGGTRIIWPLGFPRDGFTIPPKLLSGYYYVEETKEEEDIDYNNCCAGEGELG